MNVLSIQNVHQSETVEFGRSRAEAIQEKLYNDLKSDTWYQARLMRVTPVKMVPLHPLISALTLLQAKPRRPAAQASPLLG
jgi:hypothetical protein